MKFPTLIALLFSLLSCNPTLEKLTILEVPGKSEYCSINEGGVSVLPSGRKLTPAGELIRITHDPFGMTLNNDGSQVVTLHNGVFTVINTATMEHIRVPSYDQRIASPLSKGSFLGVAFADDEASGGQVDL